ncbi:hypothetical protein AB9K35_16405 [Leisingera sp. XS_AS12]
MDLNAGPAAAISVMPSRHLIEHSSQDGPIQPHPLVLPVEYKGQYHEPLLPRML